MSDSFTTSELITATQQVFKFNPLFLKLFFRETYTFTSEEVFLDKIPGKSEHGRVLRADDHRQS